MIVILMLSGGTALEEFGTRKASLMLDALARRMPLSILGMIAAALGSLPPIGGAVAQEIIDLDRRARRGR